MMNSKINFRHARKLKSLLSIVTNMSYDNFNTKVMIDESKLTLEII